MESGLIGGDMRKWHGRVVSCTSCGENCCDETQNNYQSLIKLILTTTFYYLLVQAHGVLGSSGEEGGSCLAAEEAALKALKATLWRWTASGGRVRALALTEEAPV